jgi:hypothetical protein
MLCWGRVQGYRHVSRDREDVRIPILGASSFLEKTGLASMSCTVLAVAVMPTHEQNAKKCRASVSCLGVLEP